VTCFAGFDGTIRPLETEIAGDEALWHEMAQRHGLVEADLRRLASAWHTDLDLGRPIDVMIDMTRSRLLGFTGNHVTEDSFTGLFAKLREKKLIP
jgi:hypothetical protein